MLENFQAGSVLHCEKRCVLVLLCYVFNVFHGEKWNKPDNFQAYDTLLFKARLTMYRSLLYVKMNARYKRKTKAFHFPRGSFSLISRVHFHVEWQTS